MLFRSLWIGFSIQVDADPQATPGFLEVIPEWLRDTLTQTEKYPLVTEAAAIETHLERLRAKETAPSQAAPV